MKTKKHKDCIYYNAELDNCHALKKLYCRLEDGACWRYVASEEKKPLSIDAKRLIAVMRGY